MSIQCHSVSSEDSHSVTQAAHTTMTVRRATEILRKKRMMRKISVSAVQCLIIGSHPNPAASKADLTAAPEPWGEEEDGGVMRETFFT